MRQLRISLLKKIAQDLEFMSKNAEREEKMRLINEIMNELGREFPPPPKGTFSISENDLGEIKNTLNSVSDDDLAKIQEALGSANISSPSDLAAISDGIKGSVNATSSTKYASLNIKSSINLSEIFESLFRAKLKKFAEHNAVNAICDDLRDSGAFKLYEGKIISKKASYENFMIKENISILNSKIQQYQMMEKSAQMLDWSRIKNIPGDAVKGVISALSNAGASIMSGAWSLIKALGKGVLRALPIIALIIDVWDLVSYGYTALKAWFLEFEKYKNYGEPSELANISYLEKLYSDNKDDLKKVLDISRIINISKSFDEGWVLAASSLFLVIEDIITMLVDLTGIGLLIGTILDFLISAGVYYGSRYYESGRMEKFEDLKDVIAIDVGQEYRELQSDNANGNTLSMISNVLKTPGIKNPGIVESITEYADNLAEKLAG